MVWRMSQKSRPDGLSALLLAQLAEAAGAPVAGPIGVIQLGGTGAAGRRGGAGGLFPPPHQAQPLHSASSAAVETASAVSLSQRGSSGAMLLAEPSFHAPRKPM